MKKVIGGVAAATMALAFAPAGASAQAPAPPSADCSTAGVPGKVVTLNLAPLANITLRPCVPTGVAKCENGTTIIKLPANPVLRLQLLDCRS